MNLTDLRDELTTHADDLGSAPDFRAGVADRVRRTKRRRAAAAGAGAALAVAALAVGTLTSLGRPAPSVPAGSPSSAVPMVGADGMPYRTVPDAPGDITKDGLRLRARVADDLLEGGAIGDRGQSRIAVDWVPSSTSVSLVGACYLDGAGAGRASEIELRVRIEGMQGYFGSTCLGRPTERDLPTRVFTPGEPGRGWAELTVRRPATLIVEVVDRTTGKPLDGSDVQVAGAVYTDLGHHTPIRDASGKVVAVIPNTIEHQGYTYTQVRMSSAPLPRWQDLTVGVDPGAAMVLWGSAGEGLTGTDAPDESGMRLARYPGGSVTRGYGWWGTDVLPADSTVRVTASTQGARAAHGSGFIAVYAPSP